MQPMPSLGYDRAITVFSPDGRLFQVEYAREAVKRGTTSLGIRYKDGVLLAVDKRITSKLVVSKSIEKIFQVDENIAASTSGLVADARVIVDRARVEAQTNRISYNEPIDLEILAKKLCDFKQLYTQHGGVRPFGIALLLAGVNEKPRLFETDPSGALIEYRATAIGSGRTTAMEIYEEEYREDMSKDDAIALALKIMNIVTEGKITEKSVEVALVELKTMEYRKLTVEEIKKQLSKIPKVPTKGAKKE
ncbi:MAG: archaeal proteasome endopeptidase complex subunit alpha [Candidatus Hydrothermarchaeales archaeon]